MKEIGVRLTVAIVAFFSGMAATLFLIPFWAGPLISAVQEGKPADWIGFAGNFGAGLMTLIAAGAAIYGATFAARPVYDQLLELARQNDVGSLGVLSKRSLDLNNERILIHRIITGVVMIDTHLKNLLANSLIPETGELVVSIDRFEEAVDDLRASAGIIWGTVAVQKTKRVFLDAALDAATNIMNINRLNPPAHPQRIAAFRSNAVHWQKLSKHVKDLGHLLHDAVDVSADRTSAMLADLEHRVF
ncbi:hypothetical protein [Bradyrhizobium monzae]|uniref:hypothetical protein n=1 Tax=Bradyrhizobium sp. Oc8 TaxID=2876780 RepID=UPI001F16036F|nr:hypothetical protein [Bradyrhizobium sp. Oc8]